MKNITDIMPSKLDILNARLDTAITEEERTALLIQIALLRPELMKLFRFVSALPEREAKEALQLVRAMATECEVS